MSATAAQALDALAERYVRLGLELGEHDPDFVDAYLGPAEWARSATRNLRSVDALAAAIDQLYRDVEDYSPGDPESALRRRALLRNVRAMNARIRMVRGETFSFAEEARLLYDVDAPAPDDREFDRALDAIDALFPGEGDLADRVDAFRRGLEIPDDRRDAVIDLAIAECKRRTDRHIRLPDSERFTLDYVTGESWSGYNWYQGQNESLLQINVDFPIRIGSAVSLGCHEGYPGHHVWNVLVENRLLAGKGWIEYSLFPLFSPSALIAEGSAEYGIELAFPGDERIAFERDVLFPAAGLDPELSAKLDELRTQTRRLDGASAATAALYLDGEISAGQAIERYRKYGLISRERAERNLRFAEQYRSYVLNYGIGEQLVRRYVERSGDDADVRWAAFERILTELLTATDLTD